MSRTDPARSLALPRTDPARSLALPRRRFLAGAGTTLSATAVGLLAGAPGLLGGRSVRAAEPAEDVAILDAALAAEHRAVAAYRVGAESGLLRSPARGLALTFQGHHRQHADLLADTIRQLGGAPPEPHASYAFPVETLRSEEDVLRFAAGLEQEAVSAYLGAVPRFGDRDLAHAAASILGDEAMHWAVLRHALGEEPVPGAFVS